MPKITEKRFTCVLLREIRPGTWRVDYRDPLTRKRCRVLLPVSSFKDAEKEAKAINDRVGSGKGFSGRIRGSVGHTVQAAVKEAIKHTSANERTRADYSSRYNGFSDYLTEKAPGVQSWTEVTEAVIENYIQHCRREGISHETLKSRVFVLRMTSDFMSRTYPSQYRNITARLKLRRTDPPKAEREAKDVILSLVQYRAMLKWLKENAPMFYVLAILQGSAGLRMLEGCYLREQDLDPDAGTITITESSAHKPKNRPSFRTIPVAPVVVQALQGWIGGLKVRHAEGFMFLPTRGWRGRMKAKSEEARAGVLTRDRISHLWVDAVNAAREAKVDLPAGFIPRKLRGTFVTAMRKAGADFEILQRYIGHAPASILSAHYDEIDMDRLKAVATLAQEFSEGSGRFKEAEKAETKNSGFGQ